LFSSGTNDEPTVKFAGDGNSDAVKGYSERRILRVQALPAGRNRATCCA
jgi:hypothetical protein